MEDIDGAALDAVHRMFSPRPASASSKPASRQDDGPPDFLRPLLDDEPEEAGEYRQVTFRARVKRKKAMRGAQSPEGVNAPGAGPA